MGRVVCATFLCVLLIPLYSSAQEPFTGTFTGTAKNETVNEAAAIEFKVKQHGKKIEGCIQVEQPLIGSGPFEGDVDGDQARFVIPGALGDIVATGRVKGDLLSATFSVSSILGGKQFSPAVVDPSGVVSQKFDGYGIALLYPNQWTVKQRQPSIVIGDGTSTTVMPERSVEIGYQGLEVQGDLEAGLNAFVLLLQSADPSLQTVGRPVRTELGGYPAIAAIYVFRPNPAKTYGGMLVLVKVNHGAWIIRTAVPQPEMLSFTHTFTDLLSSVHFSQPDGSGIGWQSPGSAAKLTVRSTPGGVQVYLDDELKGTTDENTGLLVIPDIALGNHRLRLTSVGFKQLSRDVQISTDGQNDVVVTLEARDAPLTLNEVESGIRQLPKARAIFYIKKFGVDFSLTEEISQRLRKAGADDELLLAVAENRR